MGLDRRPDRGFWSGKRVLLTGHSGFKGAWTAIWLARLGARVTGLALPPEDSPSLFELAGVAGRVDDHVVDLRDRDAVIALAQRDYDVVLHMAAQALVRESIRDPIATFATNVMGTAHLLDALRGQPALQALLVITSDKVYANAETGHAFVEGDALGGKDPYSASKAAAEIITASFARSFFARRGIPLATARGGNVIGGGDFSRDRIVADIVRAALAQEETVLRHPEATRPWQHVLDCVAGYLVYAERLAGDPSTPTSLNFGPRPRAPIMTVGDLASRAVTALGAKPWRHEPDPTSVEARALGIDTSLAREILGFESRLDAPAAVDWTIDWYRHWADGDDARALCEDQISRYEDSL